jgi:predicted PurR-regulated permease PerM
MANATREPSSSRILLALAAFVIVIAGMRAAAPILVPFLLAVFIAILAAPPMFWLKKRGVPTVLAMLAVVAVLLLIASVLGMLVGASIADFQADLPEYQARVRSQVRALIAWLQGHGVTGVDDALLEYFDPSAAMGLVARTLAGFGGMLTNAFLIILTAIFILLEASSFPAKLRSVFADPEGSLGRLTAMSHNVERYMEIKTTISVVTGGVIYLWLVFLGVKHALLWGLLAFLLNFVPTIGSIIAGVPAVLLALVQLGVGGALLTASGYVAVNVFFGNIIEPRFMGRGLGLSTLVVFLSLVFWGWVLGPVGMLLSVPLTMTFKLAMDATEETRWVAVLLGPEVRAPPPVPEVGGEAVEGESG